MTSDKIGARFFLLMPYTNVRIDLFASNGRRLTAHTPPVSQSTAYVHHQPLFYICPYLSFNVNTLQLRCDENISGTAPLRSPDSVPSLADIIDQWRGQTRVAVWPRANGSTMSTARRGPEGASPPRRRRRLFILGVNIIVHVDDDIRRHCRQIDSIKEYKCLVSIGQTCQPARPGWSTDRRLRDQASEKEDGARRDAWQISRGKDAISHD